MESFCSARLMPSGVSTCRTASPVELSLTPWNLLGRIPADHCRAAIGWFCPPLPLDISTTKPGRSSVIEPRPYSSHEPMLGRPGRIEPVFISVCAGSWLICSVHIERIRHTWSASPPICGNSDENSSPDFPYLLNGSCGP